MLSAAHTLISLPLGFYLNNPVVIFIAAFALHLAADALPHWNIYPQNYPRFPYKHVAIDVIGGLMAAYLLIGSDMLTLPYLAAIAGGNAPDILHSLWLITKDKPPGKLLAWAKPFFTLHDKIQFEVPHPGDGLISQVIAIAAAIAALPFVS